MATLIKPHGVIAKVTPANGKKFTLQELQFLVGGYVEPIRMGKGMTMLVDEDGHAKELPVNEDASRRVLLPLLIVGNALIVSRKESGI